MADATNATNPPALTPADLNTTLNHEPRIHDLRLAEVLGFTDPHKIRDLIERHLPALETFGPIFRHMAENARRRGRPGKGDYWLSKKQALYITAKSDTEQAALVTIRMVEVFDAATAPAPAPMTAAPVPPFCAACRAADLWRRGVNTATDPNALVDRPLSGADLRVLKVIRQLIDQEVDSVLSLRSLRATAAVIRILRGEELTGGGDA